MAPLSAPAASLNKTRDLAYAALFAVLIAVCAWITIPTVVPFTLQTFAVFLSVGVMGGRRGTMAVATYLLLGMAGVPVFSGFTGGLGVLLHATGGYLVGFLACTLLMWGIEALFGRRPWILALSMVLGLLACYSLGTFWFLAVYARTSGAVGLGAVLSWCVLPFLLPDAAKLVLAFALSRRLAKLLGMRGP